MFTLFLQNVLSDWQRHKLKNFHCHTSILQDVGPLQVVCCNDRDEGVPRYFKVGTRENRRSSSLGYDVVFREMYDCATHWRLWVAQQYPGLDGYG